MKAGWECGGYRDLVFRHETNRTIHKVRARFREPILSPESATRQPQLCSTTIYWRLCPPIQDQGIAFFMKHYVSNSSAGFGGARGFQEFLPALYSQTNPSNALSIILTAVGFASLSNAAKQPDLASTGRQMYLFAITLVSKALENPIQCKSDEFLAAVLLLGVFEVCLQSSRSDGRANKPTRPSAAEDKRQ
jgi:hypothetical protein